MSGMTGDTGDQQAQFLNQLKAYLGTYFASQDTNDKLRAEYLDQMKTYLANQNDAEKSLDQGLLTLQAASFATTIALLAVIVPQPTQEGAARVVPDSQNLLFISWGLIALSMAITLISYMFSRQAWYKAQKNLNARYRGQVQQLIQAATGVRPEGTTPPPGDETRAGETNEWSWRTGAANVASLACYIIGILVFAAFAYVNVSK